MRWVIVSQVEASLFACFFGVTDEPLRYRAYICMWARRQRLVIRKNAYERLMAARGCR